MKSKYFFSMVLLFLGTVGFSQSGNLDKDLKEGISELSEILETLDFDKLFNEDLFPEIEKMKPSKEQLGEMESMMQQSLKAIEKIDFSAFEDLFSEMEKAMEEIKLPSDSNRVKKKSQPSKGKRI